MCVIQRCKKISSSGEVRYQSESIVDISFVEIRELDFICWLFRDALTMISLEQCFKWLSAVVAFKAGGPDDISNWVLREFAVELVQLVCLVLNTSFITGPLPEIWKWLTSVLLPKLTTYIEHIEKDNRPISLTPTLSKSQNSLLFKNM